MIKVIKRSFQFLTTERKVFICCFSLERTPRPIFEPTQCRNRVKIITGGGGEDMTSKLIAGS